MSNEVAAELGARFIDTLETAVQEGLVERRRLSEAMGWTKDDGEPTGQLSQMFSRRAVPNGGVVLALLTGLEATVYGEAKLLARLAELCQWTGEKKLLGALQAKLTAQTAADREFMDALEVWVQTRD